jgi:hypothetical protein
VNDFVTRHGLWSGDQKAAAGNVVLRIDKRDVVRFAFADPHGVVRGKTLIASEAIRALRSGVTCTVTIPLIAPWAISQSGIALMSVVARSLSERITPMFASIISMIARDDDADPPLSQRGSLIDASWCSGAHEFDED